MVKNAIRGYILVAASIIIFSIISFAPPFEMNEVFWNAYIFGLIAIVYQIYVFTLALSGDGSAKSRFYGFPIIRVGAIYMLAQLLISLAEMLVAAFIPAWTVYIVNVIILALSIVGCVAADIVRDEVEKQDKSRKVQTYNMGELRVLSESLVEICNNNELKSDLQKLAEDFRYSDPVSTPATDSIELELRNKLNGLKNILEEGDNEAVSEICRQVKIRLDERNRICKMSK